MSKEEGVWRTVSGRRIFIAKGQSLSDAMKKSGKFRKMSNKQKDKLKKMYKDKKLNDMSEKLKRLSDKAGFDPDKDVREFSKLEKQASVDMGLTESMDANPWSYGNSEQHKQIVEKAVKQFGEAHKDNPVFKKQISYLYHRVADTEERRAIRKFYKDKIIPWEIFDSKSIFSDDPVWYD